MRKLLLYFLILLITSCNNKEENIKININEIKYITSSSFVINGYIKGEFRDYNFVIEDLQNKKDLEISAIGDRDNLYGYFYNLEPNTDYYVSLFSIVHGDTVFSDEQVVKTKQKVTITDSRDSNKYEVVIIGDQTWFAENANFYIEGSCYYDKDSLKYENNGRLYTWEMAQKVCPEGWRLPSDDEWKNLELFLGMSEDYIDVFDRPSML